MIVYKLDNQTHSKANAQIRDMAPVLDEISGTLQHLLESLQEHARAMSSPSIDTYRVQLLSDVAELTKQAKQVAEHAKTLVAVSDQASKHLAAVEEHFDAILKGEDGNAKVQPAEERSSVRTEQRAYVSK